MSPESCFYISKRIHCLYQLASYLNVKIFSSFKALLKSNVLQKLLTNPFVLVIHYCVI